MREMKESGIPWVGEILKNWTTLPVYCLFDERKHKNFKGKENNLLSLSYGKIIRKDIKSNTGLLPESYGTYNIVEKGDIIIRPTDLQNDKRSLRTGLVTERGIITSAYIALAPKCHVNVRYYHYLLHSYDTLKVFYNMGNGVRQGLNYKEFSKLMLLNPSLPEQQAIADYLDAKCADIDALQQDLQAEIETLQAYKKSLITRAVTKGLDPHVEMKDSRIPWVKRIPKHWEVKRLKFIMDNFDYERIPVDATKRNQDSDQLYDYYGASGIIDKIDGYTSEGTRILIGEDGANLVLRNLPVIYIAHGKYWVNNHAHILAPKENGNLYFYAYQMECVDYTEYITGSAQPKLSQKNLGQVYLVVPPINEQNTIAGYLDSKCSEIDSIIASKQKQSEILSDYKKSLIYEMVTGKKEVPVHE